MTRRAHNNNVAFTRGALQTAQALGRLARGYMSSSQGRTAKESLAGGVKDTLPLTTQRDTAEYYRKGPRRRLTRRARVKKLKRRRFSRAVKKVMLPRLGTYQFVKANVGNFSYLANVAVAKGFMLGHSNTGISGQSSLLDASDQFFTSSASLRRTGYILLQTMTMELSMLASSTNTGIIDLDVYTLECVKDTPRAVAATELVSFYDTQIGLENTSTGVIPVTDGATAVGRFATTVESTDRGWTPWNASLANRYWRIVKKEKILLTPGATTHIQLHKRFKTPKRIPTNRINDNGYLGNITCAYLVQAFSLWNGTAQPAGQVFFNTEYTYALKYEPNNESTVQLLP